MIDFEQNSSPTAIKEAEKLLVAYLNPKTKILPFSEEVLSEIKNKKDELEKDLVPNL